MNDNVYLLMNSYNPSLVSGRQESNFYAPKTSKKQPSLEEMEKQLKQDQAELIKLQKKYDKKISNPLSENLKSLAATITEGTMGFFGANAVLWFIQNQVNSKFLVNTINKRFTKKLDNYKSEMMTLKNTMYQKNDLGKNNLRLFWGAPGEAYYSHIDNKIVIGKGEISSLFHEMGHAVIENNTKLMKNLQRFRGHYSELALGLYLLTNTLAPKKKQEDTNNEENSSLTDKIKNIVSKNKAIIPLLAYSPELITEYKASKIGLNFLKSENVHKTAPKLYKLIKKSYITCFSTYLFIPVSLMLLNAAQKGVEKMKDRESRIRSLENKIVRTENKLHNDYAAYQILQQQSGIK